MNREANIHAPQPSATTTPPPSGVLQRKCACGTHTVAGGACESCGKEKTSGKLQRTATNSESGNEVPPIVHDVLRSTGQPLDAETRSFFEPRFEHDFSHVRIHTDARAAESAQAVNALAYTLGRNIVFGAGQYQPESAAGKQLLAHELTHTVQQGRSPQVSASEPLTLGTVDSPHEREATSIAQNLRPAASHTAAARSVQRKTWTDLPIYEERPEIVGPNIGKVADYAGVALSKADQTNIEQMLSDAKMPAVTPLAAVQGAKFLLHDTSSPVSAKRIKELQNIGRGPMGAGVSAYVPRDDPATVARPNFYETQRPSTTEFEKGIDIIKQEDREAATKEVWKFTNAAARSSALDAALKDQNLKPDEITNIKKGAEAFLKGGNTTIDGAKTTAAWAVGEICAASKTKGSAAVAESGKEKELNAACQKLEKYLAARPARVGSLVTVEIVQVGTRATKAVKAGEPPDKVNVNSCDPNNPDMTPIPNPPYSDNQYANIALLYLRAALTAGRFPETTTHFVVDAFDRGHCDPRCFDLMKLYDTIAASLKHGKGSTYGVKPKYGRNAGTDTVWWSDKVCGGPHP